MMSKAVIENGRSNPSFSVLYPLVHILDIPDDRRLAYLGG